MAETIPENAESGHVPLGVKVLARMAVVLGAGIGVTLTVYLQLTSAEVIWVRVFELPDRFSPDAVAWAAFASLQIRGLTAVFAAVLAVWAAWVAWDRSDQRYFAGVLAIFSVGAADEGRFRLICALQEPAVLDSLYYRCPLQQLSWGPMLANAVMAFSFAFAIRWTQEFPEHLDRDRSRALWRNRFGSIGESFLSYLQRPSHVWMVVGWTALLVLNLQWAYPVLPRFSPQYVFTLATLLLGSVYLWTSFRIMRGGQ